MQYQNINKIYLHIKNMKRGMKKEAEREDMNDMDDDVDETPRKPYEIRKRTFGQKAADVLTNRVGSWPYIITLVAFLLLWMVVNTSLILAEKSWDPHPFILLNLVIGSIAAIEVPIILMSQIRQSQHDRAREEYDYAVNRKSEKEVREIKEQLSRIEERLEE